MLPKVQSPADVQALDMLLTQIEETTGRTSTVGIEPQIETARPHQRRGDLRRAAAARDDRVRPRRLRGVDRDARPHRRRADLRVPRRPLPLRVLEDPDGRPRQRPPGHRRPVPQDPRARRAPRVLDAAAHPRLRRWACTPTRSSSSTRSSRRPRSSSTTRSTSAEAYEKATTEGGAGERKGAVMFGDEMIDEASRKMATKFLVRGERPA